MAGHGLEISQGPGFPPPVGPYSPAAVVQAGSKLAFIAGTVPADDQGRLLGVGDFERQFQTVWANIARALAELGADLTDIAYIRGNLSRYADYATYTSLRERFYADTFPDGAPPTTTLIVTSLYHPDCLLEIDITAVLP